MALAGKTFKVVSLIPFRNNQNVRPDSGATAVSSIHVGSTGRVVRETVNEILLEVNCSRVLGITDYQTFWMKKGAVASYLQYDPGS